MSKELNFYRTRLEERKKQIEQLKHDLDESDSDSDSSTSTEASKPEDPELNDVKSSSSDENQDSISEPMMEVEPCLVKSATLPTAELVNVESPGKKSSIKHYVK